MPNVRVIRQSAAEPDEREVSTAAARQQARTELSTAIEMYQAMEMTFWLPQTERALAQVER